MPIIEGNKKIDIAPINSLDLKKNVSTDKMSKLKLWWVLFYYQIARLQDFSANPENL